MAEKHGVIILKHKDWNTKQIWNRGHLMTTYRYQPKHLHFKHRMVNNKNQDLCGGWFMDNKSYHDVQEETFLRIAASLKPAGIFFFDKKAEAERFAAEHRRRGALDARVGKTGSHNTQVMLAHQSTLRDLFNLPALARDYIENDVISEDIMFSEISEYGTRRLIDFADGWDVEDVPMWVTGLILGYPIENTISLYRGG